MFKKIIKKSIWNSNKENINLNKKIPWKSKNNNLLVQKKKGIFINEKKSFKNYISPICTKPALKNRKITFNHIFNKNKILDKKCINSKSFTNNTDINCNNISQYCRKNSMNNNYSFNQILKMRNLNFNKKNNFDIYLNDIYNYWDKKEISQLHINNNIFLYNEGIINNKMRLILFNWIQEISTKFDLKIKTTIIIFELIDFFLCYNKISKKDLQLLGIASLFIATKYEEIYPPSLSELKEICNDYFTKNQFFSMECTILNFFKFNINRVYRIDFFYFFSNLANLESKIVNFGLMLLEITFLNQEFYKYEPSILGFSIIYLIIKIFKIKSNFINKQEYNNKNYFVGYIIKNMRKKPDYKFEEKLVKICGMEIYYLYKKWDLGNDLKQIGIKYYSKKYDEVGKYRIIKFNN